MDVSISHLSLHRFNDCFLHNLASQEFWVKSSIQIPTKHVPSAKLKHRGPAKQSQQLPYRGDQNSEEDTKPANEPQERHKRIYQKATFPYSKRWGSKHWSVVGPVHKPQPLHTQNYSRLCISGCLYFGLFLGNTKMPPSSKIMNVLNSLQTFKTNCKA